MFRTDIARVYLAEWGIVQDDGVYVIGGDETKNYFYVGYLGPAAEIDRSQVVTVRPNVPPDEASLVVPGRSNMFALTPQQQAQMVRGFYALAAVGALTGGAVVLPALGPYISAALPYASIASSVIPPVLSYVRSGSLSLPAPPSIAMPPKFDQQSIRDNVSETTQTVSELAELVKSLSHIYKEGRSAWDYSPETQHRRVVELERARRRQTTAQTILRTEGANALPSTLKCPTDFLRSPYLDANGVAHTNNMYETAYGIDDPLLPELKDTFHSIDTTSPNNTHDTAVVLSLPPGAGNLNGQYIGNSITVRILRISAHVVGGGRFGCRLIAGFTRRTFQTGMNDTATAWPNGFIYSTSNKPTAAVTTPTLFHNWNTQESQNFSLVCDRYVCGNVYTGGLSFDLSFPVQQRCTLSLGTYTDWRPFMCLYVWSGETSQPVHIVATHQVFYSDS